MCNNDISKANILSSDSALELGKVNFLTSESTLELGKAEIFSSESALKLLGEADILGFEIALGHLVRRDRRG